MGNSKAVTVACMQGHAEPAGDEQPAPIPGLAQQPDWFNAMMEQAQSVGLWGGVKTESREVPDRDCSLPSGPPILPQHLLSRAASCESPHLCYAEALFPGAI